MTIQYDPGTATFQDVINKLKTDWFGEHDIEGDVVLRKKGKRDSLNTLYEDRRETPMKDVLGNFGEGEEVLLYNKPYSSGLKHIGRVKFVANPKAEAPVTLRK